MFFTFSLKNDEFEKLKKEGHKGKNCYESLSQNEVQKMFCKNVKCLEVYDYAVGWDEKSSRLHLSKK